MSVTYADSLGQLAAELDRLALPEDQHRLAQLQQRLAVRRLRILIVGEAKRGKSTLVNRLLEREIMPTGVTPVTAVATTVLPAEKRSESIRVSYLDGRQETHAVDDLPTYITERENPGNARHVSHVEVLLRCAMLEQFNVELTDTPGTGSVYAHNTAAAEQILDTLDAAIFVVTADPPISATERDLLRRVGELAVHTFVVLNKADQLDPRDLRETVEFTAEICRQATGHDTPIFACSARAGRDDAGYRNFADAFERYLAERADPDATAALQSHLSRLASAMLDTARLTERSLQLAATTSADRVALFRERADEIAARRRTTDDGCWAAERRIRRELDSSASEQVVSLTRRCRQEAMAALDGALAELPPAELESRARDVVVQIIHAGAEQWRAAQANTVERELGSLSTQVATDLERQLVDLRAAAQELLDVELTAKAVPHALQTSKRFWYAFDRGVAWELPLAEAARNLLPGRTKRARERVLGEIAELVDRQLGRARADLAQRLRESVRSVLTQLHAEHDEVIGRVLTALDEAAKISGTAAGERDRRHSELTDRTARLGTVVATLGAGIPD